MRNSTTADSFSILERIDDVVTGDKIDVPADINPFSILERIDDVVTLARPRASSRGETFSILERIDDVVTRSMETPLHAPYFSLSVSSNGSTML